MPPPQKNALDALLSFYQLHEIIKACRCCFNTQTREIIANALIPFANKNLCSNTITILSIGAAQLKQELITAEILMKAGYHVKFILIEPIYYTQTDYLKLDYAALTVGFQKIASELALLYGKQCTLVGAFPSLYFYFKTLLQALKLDIDKAILQPSFAEFQPLFTKFFFLNLPVAHTVSECLHNPAILEWSQQHPSECLFIKTPSDVFVAYCCITKTNILTFEQLEQKLIPSFNKLSEKLISTEPPSRVIECSFMMENSELKGVMQLLLQHTKVLVSKKVHASLEAQLKNTYTIPASELLADVFMVVDSNNPKMHTVLKTIQDFFSQYVMKNNIFLNPHYLHVERGYSRIDVQSFNPIFDVECCLPPTLKIPKALLFSAFSKPSSKHLILPEEKVKHCIEEAIRCITGYLG